MYESITKKDEYLKISPDGTIQVGYYFLKQKVIRYVDLQTEKQDINEVEQILQKNKLLTRDLHNMEARMDNMESRMAEVMKEMEKKANKDEVDARFDGLDLMIRQNMERVTETQQDSTSRLEQKHRE